MSRVLEDRVLAAHPLAPAHRMILFVVARQVSEGQTEATVNQTLLARDLDATTTQTRGALLAGEAMGLCRRLKNGRVAFTAYDAQLGQAPATPRPIVTQPQPQPPDVPAPPLMIPREVFGAFGRRWEARYQQRFVIQPQYPRLAKALCALTSSELDQRLDAYFADADPFWADCKHSFGSFARNVNRFIPAPRQKSGLRDMGDYLRQQRASG